MSEICRSCASLRKQEHKPPRDLYEIPKSHLKGSFKKGEPVLLCEFCDGDAYEMVLAKEDREQQKK